MIADNEIDNSLESSQSQQVELMDETATVPNEETVIIHQSQSMLSQSSSVGDSRSTNRPKSNSKKAKRKSDSEDERKEAEALKRILFKEPTDTEIWCSNLAVMIEKLPECSRAETKLSILNIVGRAEIEYLKYKESTKNYQSTNNYTTYEIFDIDEPILNNSRN